MDKLKSEEIYEQKSDWKNTLKRQQDTKQIICALIINLVSFLQGASIPVSCVLLQQMQTDGNKTDKAVNSTENIFEDTIIVEDSNNFDIIPFKDFQISSEEGSWVASSWVLGHLFSACFAGALNDKIGRKKSLLIDTVVFICGFFLLSISHNVYSLIVGRFLLGYPLVSQVFLCEIVSPQTRGITAAMYSLLHSLGFFLPLILGAYLHWRYCVIIPGILAVFTLICVTFLEESPEWLQKHGSEADFNKAVQFYNLDVDSYKEVRFFEEHHQKEDKHKIDRKHDFVEDRLQVIYGHYYIETILKSLLRKNHLYMKELKSLLRTQKNLLQNVVLLAAIFTCFGFSGFSTLAFYMNQIFIKTGSPIDPSHASWITSITKIVCAVPAFYFLHKFKRRTILLLTGIMILVAFLVMAFYTLVREEYSLVEPGNTVVDSIPMFCVVLAYLGYGLGFGVLPSLIAAEIIPVKIRATVMGLFMTLEMSSTFLVSILKPMLMDSLKIYGMFFLFSSVVFCILIFTLIASFETVGQQKISDEENK